MDWFSWENPTKETGVYIPNMPPKSPVYIYVYNYINNVSCRLPLKPLYWILVFVSSLRDLNVRRCPKGIRVAELKMGTVVEPTNMVI